MQALAAAARRPSAVRVPPVQVKRAPLIARVLSPTLRLDLDVIARDVERMRRRHPFETDAQLARRCIRDAALCAGAASLVLALPCHPALLIPAAIADVVLLARLEAVTAARIAAIFGPDALGESRDPMLALAPLFGADEGCDPSTALYLMAGGSACLSALACVGLDPSRAVRRVLKHAGLGACERRLVARAIPVAGAVVGAIASARRIAREGERAVAHFGSANRARLRESGEARLRLVGCAGAVVVHGGTGPPRAASTGLRGAAVQAVAMAIRASDALAGAMRAPRMRVARVLAEGRARARRVPALAPAP